MLTAGFVPALFTDEEKENIVGSCRNKAIEAGYSPAKYVLFGYIIKLLLYRFLFYRDAVWNYFLKTCESNLHVVLTMSPDGDALRNRCRNFPGLVGSTSIDWVFPWPEQALFAVARRFLADHPSIPTEHRDSIVSHVVHVHRSLDIYSLKFLQQLRRKNFVTPKHYLDYIATYLKLMSEKNKFITGQCNRLAEGIAKIDEAAVQIDALSQMVEVQRVNVLAAAQMCETMLVGIQSCK